MHAQMPLSPDFDLITIEQLRSAASVKWTLYPDAIGMFLAEMDFGTSPAVAGVLCKAANSPAGIGYATDAQREAALTAATEWYEQNFNVSLADTHVSTVPNVLYPLALAIQKLIPAGAPVVLPTPAYMNFFTVVRSYHNPVIEVPSPLVDGRYVLDYEGIERALRDEGAKMVIIANPWNPGGRVFSREELERLDEVMSRYPDARLFMDEMHSPLVLEGTHVPYFSISDTAAKQAITALAPTKGWNIPGLKVAQLILSNPGDVEVFEADLEALGELVPTISFDEAVACYRDSREWNTSVRDYLRANRDYLEERIAAMPGVSMAHVEGTYIAWLDFTQAIEAGLIPQDISPSQWLREQAHVALTEGESCGVDYANYCRLIFATSRPILTEALDQIEALLTR